MQRSASFDVPPRPIGVPAGLPDEDIAWLAGQAELAGTGLFSPAYPRIPPAFQQIARLRMRELAAERARLAPLDTDWIEMEPA